MSVPGWESIQELGRAGPTVRLMNSHWGPRPSARPEYTSFEEFTRRGRTIRCSAAARALEDDIGDNGPYSSCGQAHDARTMALVQLRQRSRCVKLFQA
jgi:hypothetical protein